MNLYQSTYHGTYNEKVLNYILEKMTKIYMYTWRYKIILWLANIHF